LSKHALLALFVIPPKKSPSEPSERDFFTTSPSPLERGLRGEAFQPILLFSPTTHEPTTNA